MRRYTPYYYKRRSHYVLTKNEIARGIANRFVHSRTYIFLYLGMACLSATTVGLSLAEGCPGPAFYILEIIVNSAMILEVGIRFVAFGKVSARIVLWNEKLTLPAYPSAILEVPLQRCGPYTHSILCGDAVGARVRRLRLDFKRGRTP